MEPTAYEECLDLISFYEVYYLSDGGVVEGNIDGWIVIGYTVAIALIVTAIVRGGKEKTHRPLDEEFDIFR